MAPYFKGFKLNDSKVQSNYALQIRMISPHDHVYKITVLVKPTTELIFHLKLVV